MLNILGELVTKNKLYTQWNQEFDVPELDEDAVVDFMEERMK